MSQQPIEDTIASIQQILDRDYAHLEWRVLSSPPATSELPEEPFVYVHAWTRDFRYRCRVGRPSSVVRGARSLGSLVAEQTLADLAAADPAPKRRLTPG